MADDAKAERSSAPDSARDSLSEHVVRNVQAVTELHLQSERSLSKHQRVIESLARLLGRPASLYAIVTAVILWILVNTLVSRLGAAPLDPPPFFWLQGAVALAALLTTTTVLITQNRQAKVSERRLHLDLQVNLLTEQKTAKLIELVEELRRDLPNVRDRRDREAEALQKAAEPLKVIAALEEHTLAIERQEIVIERAEAGEAEAQEQG